MKQLRLFNGSRAGIPYIFIPTYLSYHPTSLNLSLHNTLDRMEKIDDQCEVNMKKCHE